MNSFNSSFLDSVLPQYLSQSVNSDTLAWVLFGIFVGIMLFIDLKLVRPRAHVIGIREAGLWSVIWVSSALIFNIFIYYRDGAEPALNFFAGYLIEKTLSVDNLFVFLLIFNYFRVPHAYMHKVLFWGVFGALVMRAIFIAAGLALIQSFSWIIYVFGAFLIVSGIKLGLEKDKEIHPEKNIVIRLFRRFIPVTESFEGDNFFIRKKGLLLATPLFIVLLMIETTDVIFAVDSIPAILAITTDPFIVYTSNIFAILGLRSLYFLLSGMMELFHHLHYGLSVILVYIGIKMLLADVIHIPIWITLGILGLILTISIISSLCYPKKGRQI